MVKDKAVKKPAILEHDGIKVGDKVKLVGVAMPRTLGKVSEIKIDRLSNNDILYIVSVKNEADNNRLQPWPVYRHELEKS